MEKINDLINQYLIHLGKLQKENGSFYNLTSHLQNNFQLAYSNDSILTTSFVILSLLGLKNKEAEKIIGNASRFLVSQKNGSWLFNNNLNTTFCALSALLQTRPELVSGEALAKILNLLTAHEIKEGGPYKTFGYKKEIDLSTNVAIAHFLKLKGVELPELNRLIDKALDSRNFNSFPYFSHFPTLFLASCFYKHKTSHFADLILLDQDRSGKWDNPFNTSLAISSLLNFGADPGLMKKNMDYLLDCSPEDLSHPFIFLTTKNKDGQNLFITSPALCTALYIGALDRYKKNTERISDSRSKEKENCFYQEIRESAERKLEPLQEDIRSETKKIFSKIIKMDGNREILLLSYFFKKSLKHNKGFGIPDELIKKLGIANLYLWSAYTIYDDFFDDEGDPLSLSGANFCLREFISIFKNMPPTSGFHDIFSQIMNDLDAANAWEVAHCRAEISGSLLSIQNIFDYDLNKLAERSLAHCLGPVAILFTLGFHADSEEVKDLISFFRHYLIARQINDDAHDWEEDMKRGHINSVVMGLIKDSGKNEIDLEKDLESFRKDFWMKNIIDASSEALKQAALARNYALKLSPLVDMSFFQNILDPVENSARKAIKEQEEFLDFLKTYKSKETRKQ